MCDAWPMGSLGLTVSFSCIATCVIFLSFPVMHGAVCQECVEKTSMKQAVGRKHVPFAAPTLFYRF